jgi:hypothetical protein
MTDTRGATWTKPAAQMMAGPHDHRYHPLVDTNRLPRTRTTVAAAADLPICHLAAETPPSAGSSGTHSRFYRAADWH